MNLRNRNKVHRKNRINIDSNSWAQREDSSEKHLQIRMTVHSKYIADSNHS